MNVLTLILAALLDIVPAGDAAIAQLPDEQQEALHLVYFEDCSYADAAQIMKKSKMI